MIIRTFYKVICSCFSSFPIIKYRTNIYALNKIEVSGEQRDRAIDIYENLNRGGISLNTFDLVMARVQK